MTRVATSTAIVRKNSLAHDGVPPAGESRHRTVPRKCTFPFLLVPAIMIVVFTDVTAAAAIASRVFALFFVLRSHAGVSSRNATLSC